MSGHTFAISTVLHSSQLKRKQIENFKELKGISGRSCWVNEAPLRCTKDDRIGSYFSLEMFLSVTGFKTRSRGFFFFWDHHDLLHGVNVKHQMFLWNFLKELFFSQLKRFLLLPLICPCIPFLKLIMTQRKLAFTWNHWRKLMELRRHIVACIKSAIWEQQEVVFFWSVDATSAAPTLLPMKPNFPLTNQWGIRETSSDMPRYKCFLLEIVSVHNKQRKKGKEAGREFEKVFFSAVLHTISGNFIAFVPERTGPQSVPT